MKKISVTLLFVLLAVASFGTSINVQENLTVNTHWTGIDTVTISDNIAIDNGITLTIDPGIVVEVQGLFDIEVNGTIKAIGSPTDTIVFTATDKEIGWGHLRYTSVDAANDTSVFKYCLFESSKPYNKPAGYKDGGPFYITNYNNIEISNCLFRNNRGVNAIVYTSGVETGFHSNTFIDNQSYCLLYYNSPSANTTFNNTFVGNTGGAAIYSGLSDSTTFLNNLFYNNTKGFMAYGSRALIKNNTIINSTSSAMQISGDSDIDIYNTILWDNQIEVNLVDTASDPNFYYCNIQGGYDAIAGAGSGTEFSGDYSACINSDPLFTNIEAKDYSLSNPSPCKDVGTKSGFNYSDIDIVGNPRICDDEIDLGAYEYYVSIDTICDEVWSSPNDTVHVTGNVFVPAGCTLTVQPGTKVVFDGLFKITVQGVMNAVGAIEVDGQEQGDSIVFTAADKNTGWRGIKYIGNSSAAKSVFKHCIFEYGLPVNHNARSQNDGAAFYVSSFDSLDISNCTFRHSRGINSVVYINNSFVSLTESLFENNSNYSFLAVGDESSIVQNNMFINNGNTVYSGYGDSSYYINNALINNGLGFSCYNSKATIVNNTIYGCDLAPITSFGESSIRVFNSIIYANDLPVRVATVADDPDFYNCNIEGGSESFYGDGAGAEYTGDYIDCQDKAPLFIDSLNNDFRLRITSPLVDAGTADTTGLHLPKTDLADINRIIGSSIDIGAYETDTALVASSFTPEIATTHEPLLITLSFSKEVVGFQIEDIVVDNGTASISDTIIENREYEILITPEADLVNVQLPENSVADVFGNTNRSCSGAYTFIVLDIKDDISLADDYWVYPNPVQNKLFIVQKDFIGVSIFDLSGKQIDISEFNSSIDMSGLESGIYVVKIDFEQFNKVVRVIKK